MNEAHPSPKERSLAWACSVMGGAWAGHEAEERAVFTGAAIDSRLASPGRLFFALPGERVDGFAFCGVAARAGAAAVVVTKSQGRPVGCENIPVIAVGDPRRALGDLARAVRTGFAGRVVGVTGSNGKTTTKEMIAAALSVAGPVLCTQGNLNTDVGLPLTILESNDREAFWVLEMGMRARGEIAYLSAIGEPHVGVVTNVAGAHLERLGSIEEVAKAKGELFHGLASGGIAVLPADVVLLEREASHLAEDHKLRFAGPGERPSKAHVRVIDFVPAGPRGSVLRLSVAGMPLLVRLPLAGEHNARNAAAALAVVSALSLPLLPAATALETVSLPPHRSHLLGIGGRNVMDDCYNANPASMLAALRGVSLSLGAAGRGFAILGDMLELGPQSAEQHVELGKQVAQLGFSGLAGVGELAVGMVEGALSCGMSEGQVLSTMDPAAAADAIARWSLPGDWVLVKASRGMRLERALEALQKKLEV